MSKTLSSSWKLVLELSCSGATKDGDIDDACKQTLTFAVADLWGGTGDARPAWESKFFQFHAVFGKFWQNRMLAPPPGELAPPPRGNPGSATGLCKEIVLNFLSKMAFCWLFTAMQAPVFTRPLEGTQYVEPGVSHVLECDARGLPLPVITWFIDGSTLEEGDFEGSVSFNANKTRFKYIQLLINPSINPRFHVLNFILSFHKLRNLTR